MKSMVHRRTTCRLCNSPSIELALPLTPCPPVDAFVTEAEREKEQACFPIDLYLCLDCGHAQLLDVVNPEILFGSYIYTTASSPGLVEYFSKYADSVYSALDLSPGMKAIDIGCNDGTLLSFFQQKGLTVLGVDPATEIVKLANARGIETLAEFFNAEVGKRIATERGKVNLITANNVFSHADDLGNIADGVQCLLTEDGVFIFEVSYLLDMVDNMVFDFIYHEHLSHHSVQPLQRFLSQHGLHLFNVERTPSKGGTIRCFTQLKSGPRAESAVIKELIELENKRGLYSIETYRTYANKISEIRDRLNTLLSSLQKQSHKIAGYGASATGTVLTYHFGLAPFLEFIIDDNPVRQNRFSPGDHIPILGSDALEAGKPDYVLILAWRFADLIVSRNSAYLQNGGKFIIPLPEIRVVG